MSGVAREQRPTTCVLCDGLIESMCRLAGIAWLSMTSEYVCPSCLATSSSAFFIASRTSARLKSDSGSLANGASPDGLATTGGRGRTRVRGFMSNCSSGTCSVKLARKKDSLAVFSRSRRTRYAMPGSSWPRAYRLARGPSTQSIFDQLGHAIEHLNLEAAGRHAGRLCRRSPNATLRTL